MDVDAHLMRKRRVLVIDGRSLLAAGMRQMLSVRQDVELSSSSFMTAEGLERELREFRPDLVVFDQYERDILCSLLERDIGDRAMTIVEVSAELPMALTYQRRRVSFSEVGDLLALID